LKNIMSCCDTYYAKDRALFYSYQHTLYSIKIALCGKNTQLHEITELIIHIVLK
jgi:hypothetical protein